MLARRSTLKLIYEPYKTIKVTHHHHRGQESCWAFSVVCNVIHRLAWYVRDESSLMIHHVSLLELILNHSTTLCVLRTQCHCVVSLSWTRIIMLGIFACVQSVYTQRCIECIDNTMSLCCVHVVNQNHHHQLGIFGCVQSDLQYSMICPSDIICQKSLVTISLCSMLQFRDPSSASEAEPQIYWMFLKYCFSFSWSPARIENWTGKASATARAFPNLTQPSSRLLHETRNRTSMFNTSRWLQKERR